MAAIPTMVAVPEQVNIDTAIISVLSELENISSLKEKQRTTLKAFLDGEDVLALLPTDFGENLMVKGFVAVSPQ